MDLSTMTVSDLHDLMTRVRVEIDSRVDLDALLDGHDVLEARVEYLRRAAELGADIPTLERLRDARRLHADATTILLPAHRYEGLSRGRGWARCGRGESAVWGEREDGSYRVGPGKWDVGGSDGYRRKGSDQWIVEHVQVGDQTWTVASFGEQTWTVAS